MKGRMERELGLEKQTEGLLNGEPSYIKRFYYWLGGKKPTTKEKYIEYTLRFVHWTGEHLKVNVVSVDFFSRDLVNDYFYWFSFQRDEEGNAIGKTAPSTVNVNMCALSTFFKFLQIEGLVKENYCDNLTRPTIGEKEEVVFLEQDEVKQLLYNIEHGVGTHYARALQARTRSRDRLLVMIPLVTGIRISALLDINIEDIDYSKGILRVIEKEGKYRTFTLPDQLMDMINEWTVDRENMLEAIGKPDELAFFITEKGKRIGARAVNALIDKYSEGIDKHISAHKLRATFATATYEQTGDIYLVSQALGHRSTETTRRYARASEKKIAEASNRMLQYIM